MSHVSIVGSVVECSPATRAARVRFPDDAELFGTLCSIFTSVLPIYNIWRHLLVNKIQRKYFLSSFIKKILLETGGIDPPTSHMLSERSTI
jgi:hypothetical protein